ncbi:MAG: ribosome silencing factor [Acidimicrobiales bacterium]|nr:ribosome silencing factor [Acidimicrobiales bacterium]
MTDSSPAAEPLAADDIERWARLAADAADDKKATDPLIIDVGDVFAVSDYFVITSGSNPRLVHAIVDGIEEKIADAGGPKPVRVEGKEEREWVLMDYGPFVVHVFLQEQRDFYQLEKLWGDRPRLDWHPSAPATEAG